MTHLPRISIIIPTYNIERFIDATIRSIINQNYPNLELIIVDGLSNDKTLEKLNNYKKYISKIICESDEGQYDAINKGFSYATGEIFAYINGDDIYFPWTFSMVAKIFLENPKVQWISGMSSIMDEDGIIHGISYNTASKPRKFVLNGWFSGRYYGYLQQEGMFWSRKLWEETGGLSLKYKLAADYNLWIEFAMHSEIVSVGIPLACFRSRLDSRSKLFENDYLNEVDQISKNLLKPNLLFRTISKNIVLNRIIRKLTYVRGWTYKYYKLPNAWMLKWTLNSLSQHSVSSLLQELHYKSR